MCRLSHLALVLGIGMSGCSGRSDLAEPPTKLPKQDNSKVSVEELTINGTTLDKGPIRLPAKTQIEVYAKFRLVTDVATGKTQDRPTQTGFSGGPMTTLGVGEFTDPTRSLSIVLCEKANNRNGLLMTSYAPAGFKFLKDGRTMEMTVSVLVPEKHGLHSFAINYIDDLQSTPQPNGNISVTSKNPQSAIVVTTIEVAE